MGRTGRPSSYPFRGRCMAAAREGAPGGLGSAGRVPASAVGALAQPGEHLLCKQGVVGSIPTGSTRGVPWGRHGWGR